MQILGPCSPSQFDSLGQGRGHGICIITGAIGGFHAGDAGSTDI